jgi:hypothetical protein
MMLLFQLSSMWEEKMREELEKTTPLEEVILFMFICTK